MYQCKYRCSFELCLPLHRVIAIRIFSSFILLINLKFSYYIFELSIAFIRFKWTTNLNAQIFSRNSRKLMRDSFQEAEYPRKWVTFNPCGWYEWNKPGWCGGKMWIDNDPDESSVCLLTKSSSNSKIKTKQNTLIRCLIEWLYSPACPNVMWFVYSDCSQLFSDWASKLWTNWNHIYMVRSICHISTFISDSHFHFPLHFINIDNNCMPKSLGKWLGKFRKISCFVISSLDL